MSSLASHLAERGLVVITLPSFIAAIAVIGYYDGVSPECSQFADELREILLPAVPSTVPSPEPSGPKGNEA